MLNLSRLIEVLMGPLGIKIGQYLAGRVDLVPNSFANALLAWQDNAPALSPSRLRDALTEICIQLPTLSRSEIDPIPIGSGALCQVHRCRLPDGRLVALKLLKYSKFDAHRRTTAICVRAARAIDWLDDNRVGAYRSSIDLAIRQIDLQFDLREEVKAMEALRGRFGWTRTVRFPAVIKELVSSRAYCMEMINNPVSIHNIPDATHRRFACETLLRALYKMIFEDGLVHLDLHGGNVLVEGALAERSIWIVDCGMWARIDMNTTSAFRRLFRALVDCDGIALQQSCIELSAPAMNLRKGSISYPQIVRRHGGLLVRDFSVVALVRDILGAIRSDGRRPKPVVVQVLISLAALEATLKRSAPDLDFQTAARDFVGLSRTMFR